MEIRGRETKSMRMRNVHFTVHTAVVVVVVVFLFLSQRAHACHIIAVRFSVKVYHRFLLMNAAIVYISYDLITPSYSAFGIFGWRWTLLAHSHTKLWLLFLWFFFRISFLFFAFTSFWTVVLLSLLLPMLFMNKWFFVSLIVSPFYNFEYFLSYFSIKVAFVLQKCY